MTTYQVNAKYITKENRIRSGSFIVQAKNMSDAEKLATEQAKKLYGENAKWTKISIWD